MDVRSPSRSDESELSRKHRKVCDTAKNLKKKNQQRKKNVPHPSGEIKLPELAEQNHSFVIGEGFWCRCWKPRDGETMKKQKRERENPTRTVTSGCSKELFTSLSWSI